MVGRGRVQDLSSIAGLLLPCKAIGALLWSGLQYILQIDESFRMLTPMMSFPESAPCKNQGHLVASRNEMRCVRPAGTSPAVSATAEFSHAILMNKCADWVRPALIMADLVRSEVSRRMKGAATNFS